MLHPKLRPITLALLSSFAGLSSAFAADPSTPTVQVTANRIARSEDETLASVTVITRQDIERQQAFTLQDILSGLPGVNLVNNGGEGTTTSLLLRGGNSSHVLVMIDGFKVGSATTGAATLESIPVDQIERIELVRGPRASLYGSDALGGVLQVFTRKGVQSPGFALTGGSRSTYAASAQAGIGSDALWASAGVNHRRSKGFNACKGSLSSACFTIEPDRDGFDRTGVNVHVGGKLGTLGKAELIAQHTEGRSEYDGSFTNQADTQQQLFGGVVSLTPTENWLSTLKVGETHDKAENFLNEKFRNLYATRRDTTSWQNDITLSANNTVVLGLDTQYDKVISTDAYDVTHRRNNALFGQYLGSFGKFNAQLSARRDKNEQFGLHNTGALALGYQFSPALQSFVSYGTAFKAPSFNELYYPFYGTATLQPEKSRSKELGLRGKLGQGKWQVSAFENTVSQLITTDLVTFTAQNLASAKTRGLELSVGQRWADTQVGLHSTWQNAQNRQDGANYGKQLQLRARQTARLDVDQALGSFNLGASWNATGKRFSDDANKRKLGGYSQWDLRAEYRLDPAWRIQLRVENAFNKQYEHAYGYNTAGRGAFLTLRYNPK